MEPSAIEAGAGGTIEAGVIATIEADVATSAWPSALRRAVAAWRSSRAPELGDLIDSLGARCAAATPLGPAEWRDRAWLYDPVDASTLIAHVDAYGFDTGYRPRPELASQHAEIAAQRTGMPSPHQVERLLYMCRWPADPRVGEVIAHWLEHLAIAWPRGWYGTLGEVSPTQRLFATIAACMREVVDGRLRTRLERLVAQPPGRAHAARAAQTEIAAAALAALDHIDHGRRSEAERARVLALVERIGAPQRRAAPAAPQRYEPDALWLEIAAAPDDDEPRSVLADALLARDDPRGLVFAYQLGRVRGQAGLLIRKNWHAWLGTELSRIVMRKTSVFRRGMLETIRIGPGSTPAWLYDHVAGHRELVAVRTVRKLMVDPPAYGRFVGALPNVRTVGVDSVEIAEALRAGGGIERITGVELASRNGEPLAQILAPLAGRAPLAALALGPAPTLDQLAAILTMFPGLAITIATPPVDRVQRAALADVPGLRFG